MRSKKSDSKEIKTTHRKIDEGGAQVPGIQPIIEPEHKKGAPVPGIQPVIEPDVNPQSVPDVQPPVSTQPTPDTQPETTPEPGSSEPESSK